MHERATFYNKAARKDVTQPLLSLLGLKYISPKRQPSTETLFEIGRKVGDLPPAKNMLYVPNEEVLGRKLNDCFQQSLGSHHCSAYIGKNNNYN